VPQGGDPGATSAVAWLVGTAVVLVVLGVLTVLGRGGRGRRRALWFGLATGVTYGYNAALLAGLSPAYGQGLLGVLTAWQTYGVLVGGTVSFVFLQQALQAGDLIWAQPGITLANPLIAMTCSGSGPRSTSGPSARSPGPPGSSRARSCSAASRVRSRRAGPGTRRRRPRPRPDRSSHMTPAAEVPGCPRGPAGNPPP
jgi:hypothetical protein